MRFLKKILSFVAGCVLIWKVSAVGFVSAEEAPHDVKLTCETKYIDIDEIPEDRIIRLAVSIDNNPGIEALAILMEFDERLIYDKYKLAEILSEEVGNINFYYTPELINQIHYNIFPGGIPKLTQNSELMNVRVILPEDVKQGDFYRVSILTESSEFGTFFHTSLDSVYDWNAFSELNSGGIYITGNQPVQSSEPQPKPAQQNNENSSEENNNVEHQKNENNNELMPDSEVTVTMPIATPTVTTSLPQTTIISTIQNITTFPTVTTKVTESVTAITTEKIKSVVIEKKKNNKTWIIAVAIVVVTTCGSLFIFIKRSKNDKHEKK